VFGLCLPSDLLKNTMFQKFYLFPSSDKGVGGYFTRILLGRLERGNLNHWPTYVSITIAIFMHTHLRSGFVNGRQQKIHS
jgi:hypothetical protein